MYSPNIIEISGRSTRAYDLPTKLLQDKIIYLSGVIDDDSANAVIMQLLWLNAEKPDQVINIYINSPGGSVAQGLGIKDIIDSISNPVNTIGIGACSSMGAYLLSCGTGKRKATKNCRIMIHSVSGGTGGTIHDMAIDYEEAKLMQDILMADIASFTKGRMTKQELLNKTQRDWYMSAEEAVLEGIIDSVV